MSKVTVAIPTYNRKEYLRDCIESILKQTFQDFSIFVFDNHSDYDIQAFLAEFSDSRITLIPSPTNIGGPGNFHRIFNYVFDSEYVVVFHDDDTMHPSLLECEVSVLNSNPELAWVGTGMRFVHDHSIMTLFSARVNVEASLCSSADLTRLILQGFNLCYGSVMYRAKRLVDPRPFTNRYFKWGDRPYLVDLSKNGGAGIIRDELVNYRIHSEQDSQATATDKNIFLINLFIFYRECLGDLVDQSDRKLFYRHTADNLPLAGFSFASTLREYADVMREYRRNDLLRLRYMTPRGLYRFARGLVGFMRRK